jgi:pSer/pThr/pTyr-binding forkhead associated (FHA) protein
MPRLILSLDGVPLAECVPARDRIAIGRRPDHDLVIDHPAVSADHLVMSRGPAGWIVEDPGSTNGTTLHGRPVRREVLRHQDVLHIGRYRLRFLADEVAQSTSDLDKTILVTASAFPAPPSSRAQTPRQTQTPRSPSPPWVRPADVSPCLQVLAGPRTGQRMPLHKVVTPVGHPAAAMAAITRRASRFTVTHLAGEPPGRLNDVPLTQAPMPLGPGDRLVLNGVELEFRLA